MALEDRFLVERPAEYSVAPTYRPVVTESCLSKYVLEVDPLSFDKDRCSFSWRSPGLGVIQNSTVELCFKVRVTSRLPITFLGQVGPQLAINQVANAAGGAAQDVGFNPDIGPSRSGPTTKIALAESWGEIP